MDSLPSNLKAWRKAPSRVAKHIMKSHRVKIPKYEFPLRVRPWFVVATCIIMIMLASLGFTNFSRSLPLNDKLLHFICFCIATGVFYFIVDVEESARRIWFWRYSSLMFTLFTCFFCGGILSEFVQAALPYKVFDAGDILANLLGSTIGLYVSYLLERHYRHRREISRLYRPLSGSTSDFEDEEEDDTLAGTQLLPTHVSQNSHAANAKGSRFTDVWDEREELFGVGSDSEDEEMPPGASRGGAPPPRIVVSHS